MLKKLVLASVLALGVTGATVAQDTPVFCGTLAEADCSILQGAHENAASVTSADVDFSMYLSAEGIPDVPFPLEFTLTGTGSYSGDLSSFEMDPAAMTALMQDQDAYGEFLSGVLAAFDGQLSLNLSLPAQLGAMMELEGDVPLNLVLVDGIGYLDFASLKAALPEEAGEDLPDGWGAIDLGQAIQMAVAQGDMNMGSTTDTSAFADADFANQYSTVTRVDDTTLADGTTVAVFQTSFDFSAMMESEEMQAAITDAMAQSMAENDTEMTAEQLQMAQDLAMSALNGLDHTFVQMVDPTTSQTRRIEFDMTLDLTELMANAEAMGAEDMGDAQPVVTFTLDAETSDLNGGQTIEAPADAEMFPLEAMMDS